MRGLFVLFGLILTALPAECMVSRTCACASVDTLVERQYGSTAGNFGTLRASECADYRGDQAAVNDGRIYAHVNFQGHAGWVLTGDVYIMPCSNTFECVCANGNAEIKTSSNMNSVTLTSLTNGQCANVQSAHSSWVQVTTQQGQTGWLEKDKVAFHNHCFPPQQHVQASALPHGCPPIISRAEWGARAPKPGIGQLDRTPYYAFVHHGATAGCHTRQDCVKMIQSYQNYHMDGHGWSDIGYSFVVGEDGNVYEARGWDEVGAHTRHYNTVGLGICVIGNFMTHLPNQKAQDALKAIINCGVNSGKLTSTYTLLGHRDTNAGTVCPGDMFWAEIKNWPHFNSTVIPSAVHSVH